MQKFGVGSPIYQVITGGDPANSLGEMIARSSGYHIEKEATHAGTGTQVFNILQLTGSVVVTEQWGVITEITTLTNLTSMYADLWDGTLAVPLTNNGATLSGVPVGTLFTRDKLSTSAFSVNSAATGSMLENLDSKKVGRPFVITQKNGVDTFIRLHFTTTDNPVSFKVKIHFEYYPINGSTLAFL